MLGCTATDHGHPTAVTADLAAESCRAIVSEGFDWTSGRRPSANYFGAQIAYRNGGDEPGRRPGDANPSRKRAQSQCKIVSSDSDATSGADIPSRTDYVTALKTNAGSFWKRGAAHHHSFFTLDESAYSRRIGLRWRGTIRVCGSVRRGGFTTVQKG